MWFTILTAVLAGEPDEVRFNYHLALALPTVSRYTATSPDLLGWFRDCNHGKPYAEQVKPFGFMHLLHVGTKPQHPDVTPDPVEGVMANGKIFPVAPFDTNLAKSVAQARDRKTGEAIDLSRLKTYSETLLEYPWRSESKFLNGAGRQTGRTERCHVAATDLAFIGKEADRWEEEFYLGASLGDAAVQYGGDPALETRAFAVLRHAVAALGKLKVAEATGVSRRTLGKVERGEPAITIVPHGRIISSVRRLSAGQTDTESTASARVTRLRTLVLQEGGVRAAARRLGVDPSNLSKELRRGRGDEISRQKVSSGLYKEESTAIPTIEEAAWRPERTPGCPLEHDSRKLYSRSMEIG